MRLLLLASAIVIVIGTWSLFSDEVPFLWALVIALLLSGVSSWFLLARQREALALVLQERAGRRTQQVDSAQVDSSQGHADDV